MKKLDYMRRIRNSFAWIVNKSTRLAYTKKDDKRMPDYLSLWTQSASKNKFRNALYEVQKAKIEKTGYTAEKYHLNPVYKKMVTEPDFGEKVELTSYAVGKRKNITTKTGAVVILNDEKLLKRFCIPYYDVLDGEPPSPTWSEEDAQNYAMTMVCMPQSFEKWGLPDHLYTEVDFDLDKNADLSEIDRKWYQTFGKCQGISYNSTYEIHKRM